MPPAKRTPFFVDAFTNPQDRVANQAQRRSPPHLLQQKILRTIDEAAPRQKSKGPNTRDGAIANPLTRGIGRMEMHMLASADDEPYGAFAADQPAWIEAGFNPAEVEHAMKVIWAKPGPPGLPHRPMHYIGTDNLGVKFTLTWDAMAFADTAKAIKSALAKVAYARSFLEALTVPFRGGGDGSIDGGAPPRVLLYWPGYMSLTCFVDKITIKDSSFLPAPSEALGGRVLRRFSATIELEEIRDVRRTVEGLLSTGPQRIKIDRKPGDGSSNGGVSLPENYSD